VPPTGGFWAKFLVFRAAIDRGGPGTWLAVVMILNAVISVAYYLAVPKQMVFETAEDESPLRSTALVNAMVVLALVAIVAIFIFPNPIARAAEIATLIGG